MNFKRGKPALCCALFFASYLAFTASVAAEERFHIVESGDTLWSLSRKYSVTTEEILLLNGLQDASKIRRGQRLKIPGDQNLSAETNSASAFTAEHKVSWGETLFSLARKYSISVDTLLKANLLSKNYVLKAGDTLKVPVLSVERDALLAAEDAAVGNAPAENGGGGAQNFEDKSLLSEIPMPEEREENAKNAVEVPNVKWPVQAREAAKMTGKISGVILTGERSEKVRSLAAGEVVSAGPYRGFGRVAVVKNSAGYIYVYGGCESLSVKPGDQVSSGEELGRLGVDAVSGKPSLFLMVYLNDTPIDPEKAPRT